MEKDRIGGRQGGIESHGRLEVGIRPVQNLSPIGWFVDRIRVGGPA